MQKKIIFKGLFLTTTFLLFTSLLFSQTKENDNKKEIDQYGKKVESTELIASSRDGILVFESKDKNFKYWFDNRVFLDGAVFPGTQLNKAGSGVSIRRLRFAIKSILWKKWYGEVDLDFAGGQTEIKDAIIKYKLKDGFIKMGHFKEPYSMEATTSSRHTTFIERSLPSKFAPSRHLGLAFSKWSKKWLVISGIFFNKAGEYEEVENTQSLNKKEGLDEGISYTTRLVYNPILSSDKVIHIGLATSYRTPKTSNGDANTYRFSTRALSSINRKKYIDTDDIYDVDHRILLGYELAAAYKNFMIQGEYMTNDIYGINDNYIVNLSGGYIEAAWLIFGSKYNYNHKEGEFTQISQKNAWGELQFAIMYSYVNANDKDAAIYGGEGESYSFGLTYFANPNVKFKLNYNYINHDRYANGKGKLYIYEDETGKKYKDITGLNISAGKAGDDFGFVSFRAEIDF